MKCVLLCVVVLATIALSYGGVTLHPLSDEFINAINSKKTTWKAGRNFDIKTPLHNIKKLLGVLPKKADGHKLPLKVHNVNIKDVPESFDSREAWPECASIIGDIRDQASCGSCWVELNKFLLKNNNNKKIQAFGAVEAMSDRICIHSNATIKVSISSEDLNTCCYECGDGCNGGWPTEAWYYWSETGIVTGGKYETKDVCYIVVKIRAFIYLLNFQGCKAYTVPPCEHHVDGDLPACGEIVPTPQCQKQCDGGVDIEYSSDLRKGSAYGIASTESQIQAEIMNHGPVEADFDVYEDFLNYKSGMLNRNRVVYLL